MKKKVVIWGTKLEAEKVIFKCKMKQIECPYIIDNFEEGWFHGYEIKKFSSIQNMTELCIVACSNFETYKNIKGLLQGGGYVEFENYIWSKLWEKKIVLINANCHGTALKHYLEKSEEFNSKYAIYPVPEIWLNNDKAIDDIVMSNIDVFIHQDIRYNNKISEKLSDDVLIPKLKDGAVKICIPNFVGYGNIFHKYCREGGYASRGENPILLMYQDILIDMIYKKIKQGGVKVELSFVMEELKGHSLLDTKEELGNIERIRKREINWDIKVSEYISNHRNNARLFNDINHPGNDLMKYICDEVIKKLGCKPISFNQFGMGAEIPQCPYIDQNVDLIDTIRNDNTHISLTDKPFENYKDYVRQYIWLMYDDYLE